MSWIEESLSDVLESARLHISTLKPSEWYERTMVMPLGSAFPGPFSFDLTPYWREPLDCASKDHPAKEISIMKGAQLGGTAAVLNPVVGYTISQRPGNTMFLVGHTDLIEGAVVKIDHMIDNCGMRHLIRPSIVKAKNSRTGDTMKLKEFAGGDLKIGTVTNHNLLRQHDIMVLIVDDFDAAPRSSTQAGSTRELAQKRTSAFQHKKKIYWVSSPQVSGASNIEDVFQKGDQRYYNVPCPVCNKHIVLEWSIDKERGESAGIVWKTDLHGRLDRKSVGYVCQECGNFFNETHKYEMNKAGKWVPTVVPIEQDHYSYQISGLYAPPGMEDWSSFVVKYMGANPIGGNRDEKKHQVFMNVDMGKPYKQLAKELSGTKLQLNTRPYLPGVVPEQLSIKDGNGKIVLLTIGCDMNGTEDDARLDYEVVAWSESGSTYSVIHGSIGTFVPRESQMIKKVDRYRWTYGMNRERSVWKELDKIIDAEYKTESGRGMKILIGGVDCGYLDKYVYPYLDGTNYMIVGLKGKDIDKMTQFGRDLPTFKPAKERKNLFLAEVNMVKDDLADLMELKWQDRNDEIQPAGFMNFPMPQGNTYQLDNFYNHFEAEHKVETYKNGVSAFRWEKKTSTSQNHSFDTRIYNMVCRDILIDMVAKETKEKYFTWRDYVAMVAPYIK